MDLRVDFPAHEIDEYTKYVFVDQLPFVEMLAVRRTGLDFQEAQRARLEDIFTLRRERWAKRSMKVTDWPNKQKPEMRVAVESPGGRSDVLGKFETETTKSPVRGRSIAVPTEHVPRTGAGVIRKGWRPRELLGGDAGRQHGRGRVIGTRGDVFRGAKRTFLIRRPGGRGTIFRRHGGEVVPLYQLVPRVSITPELEFIDTAERVVGEKWAPNFVEAFDRAIRTAR